MSTKQKLQEHIKNKHTKPVKVTRFPCPICDPKRYFASKQTLDYHLNAAHKKVSEEPPVSFDTMKDEPDEGELSDPEPTSVPLPGDSDSEGEGDEPNLEMEEFAEESETDEDDPPFVAPEAAGGPRRSSRIQGQQNVNYMEPSDEITVLSASESDDEPEQPTKIEAPPVKDLNPLPVYNMLATPIDEFSEGEDLPLLEAPLEQTVDDGSDDDIEITKHIKFIKRRQHSPLP